MPTGSPETRLAGLSFPHLDLDGAARVLISRPGRARAVPWRLLNTHNIALARQSAEYAATLGADGVNLADGKPVAWALRRLSRRSGGHSCPGHVRGPALFKLALDAGRAADVGHFLLGGTPETLAALQDEIARRFPGARICGAESPPFRPLTVAEQAAQDDRIRASGADLVWVGLGAPKPDVEAARLAAAVGRPAIAVGAAFDFLAGTRPEAPVWVQRLTLEWLFRFASEPRRLWRRYTVGILQFVAAIAGELARTGRNTPAELTSPARGSSTGTV